MLYFAVSQKLKECGKAKVEHHEEIEPEGILKLYSGFDISTPSGLLERVWYDLVLQFCRRGSENLRQMTKSTFAVSNDTTRRRFVYEVEDEAEKTNLPVTIILTQLMKDVFMKSLVTHFVRSTLLSCRVKSTLLHPDTNKPILDKAGMVYQNKYHLFNVPE